MRLNAVRTAIHSITSPPITLILRHINTFHSTQRDSRYQVGTKLNRDKIAQHSFNYAITSFALRPNSYDQINTDAA